MDQRLKYRDIPWHIAVFVLPAKILGTIFIKWPEYIVDNAKECLIIVGLGSFLFLVTWLGLYEISDGDINIVRSILQLCGVNI